LREYLARAVDRATGAHTASLVTPNHSPVFPPTFSEATQASLESQGQVIFRQAAPTGNLAPTPAALPVVGAIAEVAPKAVIQPAQTISESSSPPNINIGREVPVSPPGQIQVTNMPRQPAEVPNKIMSNSPAGQRVAQTAIHNAVAAVIRAIATPTRGVESPERSGGEFPKVESAAETPKQGIGELAREEITLRQIVPQTIEPRIRQELFEQREVAEAIKVAPRQAAARGGSRASADETTLHVHIGRVEVRVAAPTPAPAPPAAKPQGPSGFAGYEAVRRYVTRNRM